MILPQFIHKVTNSFVLWADHTLLNRGQAYTNVTGSLTNYADDSLPTPYSGWGAPYKEWVTDSSVSGAVIPSGFYVNNTFAPRSSSLVIDFQNGRIISSGISTGAAVTGSYAVKDFNIYTTNQDEESLVVEICQNQSEPYNQIGSDISVPYLPPKTMKIPAIFINAQTQQNVPLALGGEDESKIRINMIVFAHDPYQLDGALGLFADTSDETFLELPLEAAPMTQWGDIKGGSYNYNNLIAASGSSTFYIDDVETSKLTDSLRRGLKTELYIGFAEFLVGQIRNPRANG